MILWKCPNGCPSVRGIERPRRKDVCRYCLACSAKVGVLVERSAPVLERRRELREASRKQRTERALARKDAALVAYPKGWITLWWERAARLVAWQRPAGSSRWDLGPTVIQAKLRAGQPAKRMRVDRAVWGLDVVDCAGRTWPAGKPIGQLDDGTFVEVWYDYPGRSGTTGRAWGTSRFALTIGADRADALATLLHELAHLATPRDRGHGDLWRAVFFEACEELLGVAPKLGDGTKRGVHDAVAAAVRASGAAEIVDPRDWRKP